MDEDYLEGMRQIHLIAMAARYCGLTGEEIMVIFLLGEGWSLSRLGKWLGIQPARIETFAKNLTEKMQKAIELETLSPAQIERLQIQPPVDQLQEKDITTAPEAPLSDPQIGKRIRNLRKSLGMSQFALAHKTQVSQAIISLLETRNRLPNPATLFKILSHLTS